MLLVVVGGVDVMLLERSEEPGGETVKHGERGGAATQTRDTRILPVSGGRAACFRLTPNVIMLCTYNVLLFLKIVTLKNLLLYLWDVFQIFF